MQIHVSNINVDFVQGVKGQDFTLYNENLHVVYGIAVSNL